MFKFIKSLWWFIKKNWFKYVRIVIVGLILTVINLIPAYIVRLLTEAVDSKTLTIDFLFYKILDFALTFYFFNCIIAIWLTNQ